MAFNKFMHPRNCYKSKKPDFKEMAVKYPEFRKHVTQDLRGKVYLDFKNADALRTLCICLLKDDFNLRVELPTERLVPTLPLRLNYIHWVEDIIDMKKDAFGLDIGTGSCCIYPLLGCRLNNWEFLATEVDEINFLYAQKNITSNDLQERITVKKVSEDNSLLLDLVADEEKMYDFCMCNPPFFIDNLEAQGITTTRKEDRSEPSSVCTASSSESVAEGGEVAFVKKMIAESLQLKNKIRVYTSMVGKKSSIPPLKQELKDNQITNYGTTEFCQGKTMRWGIAWSFDLTVKFTKSEFKTSKKEKPPLVYVIPRSSMPGTDYIVPFIWKRLKDTLKDLKIKLSSEKTGKTFAIATATAKENTWSHQRKKRREKQRQTNCNSDKNIENTLTGNGASENQVESHKTPAANPVRNTSTECKSTESHLKVSSGKVKEGNSPQARSISSQNFTSSQTPDVSCEISRKRKSDDKIEIENKIAKFDSAGQCNDEKNKLDTSANECEEGTVTSQVCTSDVKMPILKCSIDLKWEQRQIALKMKSMDLSKREAMHQVLQFIKNQFQVNNNRD